MLSFFYSYMGITAKAFAFNSEVLRFILIYKIRLTISRKFIQIKHLTNSPVST